MTLTRIKAATLAAVVVLGLAACGGGSASPSATAATGSASDDAALASIAWTLDDSGAPVLTFAAPLTITDSASRVVNEGDGAEIHEGDLVAFDYTVTDGTDGSVQYSTYDEGQVPERVQLNQADLDPAFYSAFVGHKVGADVIFATLSSDPTGASLDSLPVFIAITVTDATTPLSVATGDAVAPVDGLPTVTLGADGSPTVAIPATDPPTDLVSQTLIQGSGATVEEGQTLIVHYTGWLWDGTQFDSSWTSGTPVSFVLASSQLIEGWIQGLPGASVGSQVLLVIPPSLGYGDTDNGSIPAGSTLVFVIDILAAL